MRRLWDWFGARPDRWMVALLTVLALTKGIIWVSLFPLWKIADEPGHFDNIQYRAEHGLRGPVWNGHKIDPTVGAGAALEVRVSWKATQNYYRDTYHPFLSVVPEEAKLATLAKEPQNRETDGQASSIGYPGFYFTMGALPYRLLRTKSVINRVFAIRMMSMLFGLLAVLATYFAARCIFDSPRAALAAAILVDLQPMFSQQTAAVNNDAALFGLCALAFLFQVRMVRRAPEPQRLADGAALGAAVALAVFTKGGGWVMLLLSLGVFAWLAATSFRSSWRGMVAGVGGFALVSLAGGLWPTTHAKVAAASTFHPPYAIPDIVGDVWKLITWMSGFDPYYREYLLRSTFGQFCWMELWIGAPWLTAISRAWFLVAFGLGGALALAMVRPEWLWWRVRPMVLTALTALLAVMSVVYVEMHDGSTAPGKNIIQGRSFLYAAPAFAILVVLALGSLVPQRLRGLTLAMTLTAAMCLNAGAFLCVLRQHYGG